MPITHSYIFLAMEQLEGIKHSIKRCSEDEFEKLKYAEKQVLNKVLLGLIILVLQEPFTAKV